VSERQRRRILHINSGNIEQILTRNALGTFTERELSGLDGFFDHVYAVSFPTGRRRMWDAGPHLTFYDFDVPAIAQFRHWANPFRFSALLLWAIRHARRCGVSIVLSTDPYMRGLIAFIVAKACRLPYALLVTRDWDFDYQRLGALAAGGVLPNRAMEKRVERFVFAHADLVLADRAYYARYALANGARSGRVRHGRILVHEAHHSEPSTRPMVADELGLAGQPILLFVGRLAPEKFVSDAVVCLSRVRLARPDSHLVLVGAGPLQSELEQLAAQLQISRWVHFLGQVKPARLAAWMSSASVILGTNMGYTLVEGALSGTPIVAYDYEAHPEIVRHMETGALVPFGDIDGMASWAQKLIDDPDYGQRLGTAARALVLREHQRDRIIAIYRDAFARVLSEHDRSGHISA
jgi:glycosyltransferase involved in cell wall biosynthesis